MEKLSDPMVQNFLTLEPLDRERLREAVLDPAAGAVLVFEGTVRNHSDGITGIIALEYEAQSQMASKLIEKIISQTLATFPICHIALQHRLGRVELGEPTIIIAVSSAHRDEAYRASRFLIDEIKHNAPIWKREIFADGKSQWSQGCRAHG